MQLSGAPSQLVLPWGNGDATKTNPIPVPSQQGTTPGAASWTDGFPPLCATPVSSGGVPPSKADMNGGLFQMSAVDVWMCAGGSFPFSSVFAAAIGGYPKGSRVLNAAGTGFWVNTLDNNSTNPDTGASPTGWLPDRANASVYASAQQTLATGNSKVIWATVEFDPMGMWDAANSRFKAPWTGKYRFHGLTYVPNGNAPQNLEAMVYHNGTLLKFGTIGPVTTDQPMSYSFDATIICNAGDYLEAFMNVQTTAVEAGQSAGSQEAYVFGQLEYMGLN